VSYQVDQEVSVDGVHFRVEAGPFVALFEDFYVLRDDKGWCCKADEWEIEPVTHATPSQVPHS